MKTNAEQTKEIPKFVAHPPSTSSVLHLISSDVEHIVRQIVVDIQVHRIVCSRPSRALIGCEWCIDITDIVAGPVGGEIGVVRRRCQANRAGGSLEEVAEGVRLVKMSVNSCGQMVSAELTMHAISFKCSLLSLARTT